MDHLDKNVLFMSILMGLSALDMILIRQRVLRSMLVILCPSDNPVTSGVNLYNAPDSCTEFCSSKYWADA